MPEWPSLHPEAAKATASSLQGKGAFPPMLAIKAGPVLQQFVQCGPPTWKDSGVHRSVRGQMPLGARQGEAA